MSSAKDGSSPSSEDRESRLRDFERLLGRSDLNLRCEELKEVFFGPSEKKWPEQSCVLLDVREEWEHQFVRFPGSLHIPLSRLPLNLDKIPKDRLIVVYCHTGIRSLLACYLLAQNGYEALRNLEGGIDSYAQRVAPHLPRYRLEPGRRPPQSLLKGKESERRESGGHPWGEGVPGAIP